MEHNYNALNFTPVPLAREKSASIPFTQREMQEDRALPSAHKEAHEETDLLNKEVTEILKSNEEMTVTNFRSTTARINEALNLIHDWMGKAAQNPSKAKEISISVSQAVEKVEAKLRWVKNAAELLTDEKTYIWVGYKDEVKALQKAASENLEAHKQASSALKSSLVETKQEKTEGNEPLKIPVAANSNTPIPVEKVA